MTEVLRLQETKFKNNNKQVIGCVGENLAADYLVSSGYKIVARNWRHKNGELDIIALRKNTIVAVEVKTRTGTEFGSPFDAINATKRKRLRILFGAWLAETKGKYSIARIDGIGIVIVPDIGANIVHIEAIA